MLSHQYERFSQGGSPRTESKAFSFQVERVRDNTGRDNQTRSADRLHPSKTDAETQEHE
jgi:hypothetical protein